MIMTFSAPLPRTSCPITIRHSLPVPTGGMPCWPVHGHCQLIERLVHCPPSVPYSPHEHTTDRSLQASPLPSRDYQPRRVAVRPVLPELPRCGRAALGPGG